MEAVSLHNDASIIHRAVGTYLCACWGQGCVRTLIGCVFLFVVNGITLASMIGPFQGCLENTEVWR